MPLFYKENSCTSFFFLFKVKARREIEQAFPNIATVDVDLELEEFPDTSNEVIPASSKSSSRSSDL